MTDIVDSKVRSRMMSGIRNKNTKPEVRVRSFLHARGLRFRLHARLPGRPDIVLPRYKAAILVHGCFWHRHSGCKFAYNPKSNKVFWQTKFAGNVERDGRAAVALKTLGWRVFTVWECEVADDATLNLLVAEIRRDRS